MAVRRQHILRLVQGLLDEDEIECAPVPVEQIAQRLGVRIEYEPTSEDLSGFLLRHGATNAAIIGVNAHHHAHRQRFTIAHELGHLLLHAGDALHVDRDTSGYTVMRRDEASAKGTDPEEVEANLFAAELLMPSRLLEEDLDDVAAMDLLDDGLSELARKYEVSPQAPTFRLANLGYIRL